MKFHYLGFLFLFLFSCEKEKSQQFDIPSVPEDRTKVEELGHGKKKEGENISYELKANDKTGNNIIIIYGESGDSKRVITEIDKKNLGQKIVYRNGLLFYTKGMSDYVEDTVSIWAYNPNTGNENDLKISTADGFDVSIDGLYICFTKNGYKKDTDWGPLFRPILCLENLKNGAIKEFDFSETFLNDIWGVSVGISFDTERKVFYIEYSQDAPGNIGKLFLDPYQNTISLLDG